MANPEFFLSEFTRHAIDGFIGDPNGKDAYGYLRVSSKLQAEEGKTGLPRQIESIHLKALEQHYRISWNMIFADDHTGFEFEDRPQLQKLLTEIRNKNKRRANAVIIENIDRLSRNADWHQGYLLEQFKKYDIAVFAFKEMGNRITRSVLGAVAQDGMEDSIRRMAEGMKKKLQSGRVTGKTPAYGYKLVDSNGNEGAKARLDSHYAIREDEAEVVRFIYNRVAIDGVPLRTLCAELDLLYKPPKKSRCWEKALVSSILKNEVYYGEYIGNRKKLITVPSPNNESMINGSQSKTVKKVIHRPKEEWIIVPVPPIVSKDIWQRANDILVKNSQTSSRNGHEKYLLTGLVKCATCGYTYIGQRTLHSNGVITYHYRCSTFTRGKTIKNAIGCTQGSVGAKGFEAAVWKIVCDVLTDPTPTLEALETLYNNEDNGQIKSQIKYLKDQIEICGYEDKRVIQGYNAGVFTEQEAIEQRLLIKQKIEKHKELLNSLQERLLTTEEYEAQKILVLDRTKRYKAMGIEETTDFDEKRRILRTNITKIVLNTHTKRFEVFGIARGIGTLGESDNNGNIESNQLPLNLRNVVYIAWKLQFQLANSGNSPLFIGSPGNILSFSLSAFDI